MLAQGVLVGGQPRVLAQAWDHRGDPRFMAVFVPYYQRAGGVLDRYDPAVLVAAARQVSDYDDEIPLRPEEITT